MCGIAGILNGAGSARPLIEQLAHRGPNGIRVESGQGWSVGHARLSIIDLEGGWQPLHAAGSTIIGNGEIYNYLELADEFGLRDQLSTGSDFEPLLHLYAREGEKAFQRLRGMYAFCLIGGDGRTWLVRDPFGIKPLSITRSGESVSFASEPRAQFAEGDLKPSAQPEAVEDLLTLGYVTPGVIRPQTTFRGVEALLPGEIDRVLEGDREETFDRPLRRLPAPTGDLETLLGKLDAVL
ncbi:MAG: asparagine synthetase B, partial [Caulobacteraceae bacterium]|nr:asparagine synthetase B [Caulobacteraceae bacterium]